jgi:hypothetical protein
VCAADLDGDGAVAVPDMTDLILAWGPCQPAPGSCPGDLNGDASVDVQDLVTLLLAWGDCP